MDNEKNNTKKRLALPILFFFIWTNAGISLLMSGFKNNSEPIIIVACLFLFLDIVTIVAFLLYWFRKR